ncbi:MAG: hypothetical protein IJ452_07875 [Butyricicoccus sp.]|nr:hypothetical protein [Butyricicoccus sp.]MBQ8586182.1 hypothetical protein [Butyricicoccus sp.]
MKHFSHFLFCLTCVAALCSCASTANEPAAISSFSEEIPCGLLIGRTSSEITIQHFDAPESMDPMVFSYLSFPGTTGEYYYDDMTVWYLDGKTIDKSLLHTNASLFCWLNISQNKLLSVNCTSDFEIRNESGEMISPNRIFEEFYIEE